MSKTISILGSTGSIGRQTLDVAEQMGLQVAVLTANASVERMEEQVRKFRPRLAVLTDEAAAKDLAVRIQDTNTKVLGGHAALMEAAVVPEADTVVTAVVGMVGLEPTLAAIGEKKRIALANKETLVCAGELVMDAADAAGAEDVYKRQGVAGAKGRGVIENGGKVKFRRKTHDLRVGGHHHHPFHLFCRDRFHGPQNEAPPVQGGQELILSIAPGTAGSQEHAPKRFFLCHGRIPPFRL